MAEGLDSVELWLPPKFLADDYPKEKVQADNHMAVATAVVGPVLPSESDARSPVESTAEAESQEEEDYMAGLTRQMAHSFLQDDADSHVLVGNLTHNPKFLATSPQSTLCGYGICSESSRTSHNGRPQVSSPLSTPLEHRKDDAWDMLYTAAGQLPRRRLNGKVEEDRFDGSGLLGPAGKTSITAHLKNQSAGSYATLLTQQQIRLEQLGQQQLIKQQFSGAWQRQSRARACGGFGNEGCDRPLGTPFSAWPPLQSPQQQQRALAGYGMRAVFLSGHGTRTSTGTGVFLPQKTGNQAETRKKPAACPAVLLPARVVRALNLNLDGICSHPRIPGAFVLAHDAQFARSNAGFSKQTPSDLWSHPASPAAEEIRLPAEWTY